MAAAVGGTVAGRSMTGLSAYVAEADDGRFGIDSPASAEIVAASSASSSSVKNVGTALRFMTSVADQRRLGSRSPLVGLALDEGGPWGPLADELEVERPEGA